jgi:rhodanese-related sulfurtransferase
MNTKYIFTFLLFVLFAGMVNAQQVKQISSANVPAMLKNDKKLVILDVRTPAEFKEGHIKGAINIDIRQPDAFGQIDKLDHKAKYIVHCRTNHRSQVAVDHMVKNGFKTVYQMMDGSVGWGQNGLPMEKY